MTSLLFALGVFVASALFGLGTLRACGADTTCLRIVLIAPALGSCVWTIAAFVLSEAGVGMDVTAVPLTAALTGLSLAILVGHRTRLALGVGPIVVLCVGGLLLSGWPALTLGFRWLAGANDDMATYVLGAVQVLHHGLLGPLDTAGLRAGRDWATALIGPQAWGQRPGVDFLDAGAGVVIGRSAYEVYMPVMLAVDLCAACAAGALAAVSTPRRWAALLAVGLVLISPLFTYGALQQLMPQNWGVGIAFALLAIVTRPGLYTQDGFRVRDLIPTALLLAGLLLVYSEILPEVVAVWALWVLTLALRRRLGWGCLARLVLVAVGVTVLLLNAYLVRELGYLADQVTHGLRHEDPPLFGFMLTPRAVPSLFGLLPFDSAQAGAAVDVAIIAGMVLLVVTLVGAAASLRRAAPVGVLLVVFALLAVSLALSPSDFGLFKLSMYAQPALAVGAAVGLAQIKARRLLAAGALVLAALAGVQIIDQQFAVRQSRAPGLLPDASARTVMPAFTRMFEVANGPVVSVTENPFLIHLEAASAETSNAPSRPLWFPSRDEFESFLDIYKQHTSGGTQRQVDLALRQTPWRTRSFQMGGGMSDSFGENTGAVRAMARRGCGLIFTTGREVPFSRFSFPESSPDLQYRPCAEVRNLLAFTTSARGQSFYLPLGGRRVVSFNQLQPDPYFAHATMSAFGRYMLFRVIGPTVGMRLELSLTDTLDHDGRNLLPSASVIGVHRTALGLLGRGSARVYSPPVTTQVIDGVPYLLLDLGRDGRLPTEHRSGIDGLFSSAVPLDIRYIVSYGRDVSLVSAAQYAALRPPTAIRRFPQDLANPNLAYSGVYEDGWVARQAVATLAGGRRADLVLQGDVPRGAGGWLKVRLNGRQIYSAAVTPGTLDVRVPVGVATANRRVEISFAKTIQLTAPDLRPAAAHLTFLGFVSR